MFVSAASLALFATGASAHTIFQQFYVNGVSPGHEVAMRVPSYDGPITDVTSTDVICNGGVNPIVSTSSVVQTTPAGATVIAEFHHTLAGYDPTDSADPIDPSHKGPVMAYMAAIPDATQSTVTGLSWFKIYQDGLQVSDQTWGVDRLIANKGNVTFTIPSCIPAGQYLLRVEAIALHAASSYPGAQLYMECAQLQVTGGGSTSPATVSFPGAYSGTDPGITINIYQTLSSYTIPGPSVFSCSGSSGTTTTTSKTTTSTTTTSTSKTTTSTTATSTSKTSSTSTSKVSSTTTSTSATSTATGTVAQYGQCGGTGWTGGTVCVSPYVCTYANAFYSQCL